MTFRNALVLVALLLASTSSASAETNLTGATLLIVAGHASSIGYTIVHKLHTVVGTSRKVEGKAVIKPDGTVLVQVRALVASFDSESSNRDEHMQEIMEAATYPWVEFKGTAAVTLPTSFPATLAMELNGEMDFHGRRRVERVPVTVSFASPTDVHATAHFSVSLDRYEVDRPSLLFVKIDDTCQVVLDLTLKKP